MRIYDHRTKSELGTVSDFKMPLTLSIVLAWITVPVSAAKAASTTSTSLHAVVRHIGKKHVSAYLSYWWFESSKSNPNRAIICSSLDNVPVGFGISVFSGSWCCWYGAFQYSRVRQNNIHICPYSLLLTSLCKTGCNSSDCSVEVTVISPPRSIGEVFVAWELSSVARFRRRLLQVRSPRSSESCLFSNVSLGWDAS